MPATIYALSTPPGISAVAIIRISGPDSFRVVGRLCKLKNPFKLDKRKTHLRKIFSHDGKLLDEGFVVCFDKGRSFTGEDMAEFQLHGSNIVVNTVLNALSKLSYTRSAEPGEFTKKALENNKIDLFQAEGLSDLLAAETEAQQEQALTTYSGYMSKRIGGWKESVVKMLSIVETVIDFSDDVDTSDFINSLKGDLERLEEELIKERVGFKAAESLRDGFEVAFVGKPNVGKSTILNYLAKRNLAITSKVSGTTRDIIELRFNLEGLPITFLDTAGIRHTEDEIEKVGVNNSIERVNRSDVRVFLTGNNQEIKNFGVKHLKTDIVLRPKGDLSGSEPSISGKTGKGFNYLLKVLKKRFDNKTREASFITRTRHLEKVLCCLKNINSIQEKIENQNYEVEIIAEEFRNILRNFDGLLGLVDTEEVLGEIFANFCIGK